MPFGIDLKSFAIGLIFAYFVLPWIMSMASASADEFQQLMLLLAAGRGAGASTDAPSL